MKTNIIDTLRRAAASGKKGHLNVLDTATATPIAGLTVHHDADHDYLIFEGTTMGLNTTWETKYATVQYKIDDNPSVPGTNALHLKINQILRSKMGELYDELASFYDSSNADESVWGVIDSYSDLLKSAKDGLLGFQEQVGLVGELIVLSELVENKHGPKALDYWKGPEGGLHDFVCTNNWELEVKTSTAPSPVVNVKPIEQLEPIGLPFHLVVVKIKSDPVKGSFLPDWVKKVESKLTTAGEKKKFEDLLLEVGYKATDAKKYDKHGFLYIDSEHYRIDSKTETLCPLNIKPGAKYASAEWKLRSTDYSMVACDPKFWENPV